MTVTRSARRFKPEVEDDLEPPFETDEAPRPRRRREEPEEEAPRRSRSEEEDVEADGDDTVVPIARGRSAIKSSRSTTETGSIYFKWDEDGEAQVVKFLDVDPWSYNQHWVTRSGKKSFACIGAGCPLCEIGVKASQKVVYSLVNFSTDTPRVQALEVSATLDDTLANYDADKKTGPLPRLFWAVSRVKGARSSKSFTSYNYSFIPVKERDLEEDYGIDLDVVDTVLKTAEALEPSQVLGKVSRRSLQEIADEMME